MTETMQSERWHFTVEGKFLSDLGQSLMLERNWEKALRILKTSLQGISTDHVITILQGDYALGGENSNISYHREDNTEFKKKLGWLYAGYIRHQVAGREHWYQPYAFVSGYGPRDFHNPGAKIEIDHEAARRRMKIEPNKFEKNGRAMHYAKSDTDLTALVGVRGDYEDAIADNGKLMVLFEIVENPPFWMVDEILERNRTPEDALNEFYRYDRGLEERSHQKWYGEEELPRAEEAQKILKSFRKKASLVDKLHERQAENARRWEEARSAKSIKRIRATIKKQAGKDWFELKVMEGSPGEYTVKVPRAPFEHWVLGRTSAVHLSMPWKPVSPVGLKMINDDPYHTDWLVGAGFEPDYGDKEMEQAAYKARQRILDEKLTGFKIDVLCGRGETDYFAVIHPEDLNATITENAILVLPSAHPKYLPLVAQIKSGAVIVEKGGRLAHLVNVARERDVRIVRVEGARKLYKPGTNLKVDCEKGEIEIRSF